MPTKKQQKIIYSGIIVLVTILAILIFVYLPQKAKLEGIKKELKAVDGQIAQLNELSQGRELVEVVQELNAKFKEISDLLPRREEEVVRALSELARSIGIEIKNLVPSEKELLDVQVSGFVIERQKISLDLICNFKMLGEYLHALRDEFPFLVSFEELTVNGQGEGEYRLLIGLRLSAYLVK